MHSVPLLKRDHFSEESEKNDTLNLKPLIKIHTT